MIKFDQLDGSAKLMKSPALAKRGSYNLFFLLDSEAEADRLVSAGEEPSYTVCRGPVLHSDGRFSFEKSEINEFKFDSCDPRLLTEEWDMSSNSREWTWGDVVEMFGLPGIKLIQAFDNHTIKFYGTLCAKEILRSHNEYGKYITNEKSKALSNPTSFPKPQAIDQSIDQSSQYAGK